MSAQHRNVEQIRGQLLARRSDLLSRCQRIDRDLGRQNEPLVADFGDQAIQRQNDEVQAGIRGTAGDEIALINGALARLDNGRYGLCQKCGRQIEAGRLQVVPYAVTCKGCNQH